jgi:hypothetical protein
MASREIVDDDSASYEYGNIGSEKKQLKYDLHAYVVPT